MAEESQPDFTLPPDWKDEDRMHYLLGPLVSPLSSDAKVKFWSSLIVESCRATRRITFTRQEVERRLEWRGQAASCMHDVLECMRQNNTLCMVQDLKWSTGQSWVWWGTDILRRPLKWMWNRYLSSANNSKDVYVCTQLLKESAASVLERMLSRVQFKNTDLVMNEEQLISVILEVVDASSVEVVELQLARQGSIYCSTVDELKVVKVAMPGQGVKLEDYDIDIVRLKSTIAKLEKNISSLTQSIDRLKSEARSLVSSHRSKALSCLKRSHKLQQRLESEMTMMGNLEDIMYQIQNAETHCLVLEAYKQSAKVLKTMNEMLLPAAEEAVSELDEARETTQEIEDSLMDSTDIKQLEQELEELLTDDTDELSDQLAQLALISPPKTTPIVPSVNKKLIDQQQI